MSLQSYETRINRVTAFIYEHLDQPLHLDRLADVAALSPWHWHRVYSAMRGETITDAVRRLRLMRAAADLANTDLSVEQVAKRTGYDNVQSFTRIFADAYGVPPATYRREAATPPSIRPRTARRPLISTFRFAVCPRCASPSRITPAAI